MAVVPLGPRSRSLLRIGYCIFLGGFVFHFCLPVVGAQSPSPSSQTQQPDILRNVPKSDTKAPNDEIVSHDSPTTFKVRVNVVLVRVVVRDSDGKPVTNLNKVDFLLADNRKPQIISSFSVETPASHVPMLKMDSAETAAEGTPVKAAELPRGFVTLFF